ncbi:MAG TPA: hypothetical protein VIG40_03735 [Tissierellaceae bacterium]
MFDKAKEVIKGMVMKVFNIEPIEPQSITIRQYSNFQSTALKNQLFYRGDPSELEQYFKQTAIDDIGRARFWASVPSKELLIRKFHSGLPAEIIDKVTDIIVSDLDGIDIKDKQDNDIWNEISKDNKFNQELLSEAISGTLINGDGALKFSIDNEITEYPIIEFIPGTEVSYEYKRGRLKAIIFHTWHKHDDKVYELREIYEVNKISYELFDSKGKQVSLTEVPALSKLESYAFKGNFIMALPIKFFKSPKFENRGAPLLDRKLDNFDALDEVISQWVDAIRQGRVKNYIPEDLLPKDINTGKTLMANPFDNQFIKIKSSLKEDAKEQIDQKQADIKYDAFVESYANMLDMCLQGIISPSTLGIDLKKTDNAEAQREKEKTTLYTRGKIIDVLNELIPSLVDISLKVYANQKESTVKDVVDSVSVNFGEYASPDFDSKVEVVGKAKSFGIMSLEQSIEELYGDSWTEEEKVLEVERIRNSGLVVDEQGTWKDRNLNLEDLEEDDVIEDER